MKILNIVFGILFLGTVYYATYLGNLQTVLAEKTTPEFNYLTFEMAPDREFSKSLFASIHENGMTAIGVLQCGKVPPTQVRHSVPTAVAGELQACAT